MPKPPAKKRLRPSPTPSTQREREDTRILVYQGYSVREAARLVGIAEATALQWSAKEGWLADLQRIRALAQSSQVKPPDKYTMQDHQQQSGSDTAQSVAFDLASTNRQSRAALSQIANLTAMHTLKTVTTRPQTIPVESVQDLKALTETAAKIDGSWDDASASRFAVSLNINQMVQSGAIQEIDPSVTYIEEGTGKVLYQPPTA